MTKVLLSLTTVLSLTFSHAALAQVKVDLPLTSEMDASMRMMAETYEKKVASEMQLRAIDLYAMGQALMSHEGHANCQVQGKKLIESSKQLYQLSRAILGGEELSSKEMESFVNQWTVK